MARILIIDDEEFVRTTMAQTLDHRGHTIFEAVDGKDGLNKFRENAVDVVITDILMPNKEGIETIMELRAIRRDVSIIAVSGGNRFKNASYLDAALALGADVALKKPFSLDELRRTVDRCLVKAASGAVA